jgi:hypothetical protein
MIRNPGIPSYGAGRRFRLPKPCPWESVLTLDSMWISVKLPSQAPFSDLSRHLPPAWEAYSDLPLPLVMWVTNRPLHVLLVLCHIIISVSIRTLSLHMTVGICKKDDCTLTISHVCLCLLWLLSYLMASVCSDLALLGVWGSRVVIVVWLPSLWIMTQTAKLQRKQT